MIENANDQQWDAQLSILAPESNSVARKTSSTSDELSIATGSQLPLTNSRGAMSLDDHRHISNNITQHKVQHSHISNCKNQIGASKLDNMECMGNHRQCQNSSHCQ